MEYLTIYIGTGGETCSNEKGAIEFDRPFDFRQPGDWFR
jgi:hypothetical protein